METAKVDVRKLQLLNDRINQCIDALNQVRLSVHGLSHTQANAPLGVGSPATGAFDPRFGYGMTQIPQGFQGYQGFGTGLSHTAFAGSPAGIPQTSQFPQANQFPMWGSPIGLSHTSLDAESVYNRPLWADPVLAARVAQTFPYVQYGLPPIVPVY
jgi:hypothetical protein